MSRASLHWRQPSERIPIPNTNRLPSRLRSRSWTTFRQHQSSRRKSPHRSRWKIASRTARIPCLLGRLAMAKVWECPKCHHRNDDSVTTCQECYEFRPKGSEGRASQKRDKLHAGDKVLGYKLDANLQPVRHFLFRKV